MRLQGKVAIVTGGGSGFGEGIAKRFAEEGARVVVNDIDERGGARVTAEIEKAQGQGSALFIKADVAANADVARLVRAALDRYGKLDIVVNNAGVTHINGPMLEVSEALFDRVFAVNVKSLYLSALHTVPVFRKQGGGCIINTASTAGIRPRKPLVTSRTITHARSQRDVPARSGSSCRTSPTPFFRRWYAPPKTSRATLGFPYSWQTLMKTRSRKTDSSRGWLPKLRG
jgi:NAD(P)-dependent dehydrogenase (short-subunit alcohol dehydrogenase family)